MAKASDQDTSLSKENITLKARQLGIPQEESHLEHPLFLNALEIIQAAGKFVEADRNCLERLSRPKRMISVSVPVRMDSGKVKVFPGYRVQYNSTLGPYKGGIRYHQDVCMGEVVGLAALMMMKNSLLGLPYGGGKGGVSVDPTQLSRNEKQALTRRYTSEIGPFIGPTKDIPAPDAGTDPQIMAWMMDTYSQEQGYAQPGVVTGKPVEIGGSLGRAGATGLGATFATIKALETQKRTLKGSTVVIQGFGNVGSHASINCINRGAKVLAVSDVSGGLYNSNGIQIHDLMTYLQTNKTIKGFPGAEVISNEELLELECDVLMPCALENVITQKNMKNIKAKVIIEGANGPLDNPATEYLHQQGTLIVPDILANGGGVIVSYFEWVQDIMSFFWDEDEVNRKLEVIINRAFDQVFAMANEKKIDMRLAANAVSIQRLTRAMLLRGLYPR